MSAPHPPILRPGPGKFKQWLFGRIRAALPGIFAFLRRFWPIASIRKVHVVTLHDDVREVLLTDANFKVPYAEKLKVLMQGQDVFIGMSDTPEYRSQLDRLQSLARKEDMKTLADATQKQAEEIVAASKGELELVDGLFRTVTFDVLQTYFGITPPEGGDLRIWSTRMFEYQFLSSDAPLVEEIDYTTTGSFLAP